MQMCNYSEISNSPSQTYLASSHDYSQECERLIEYSGSDNKATITFVFYFHSYEIAAFETSLTLATRVQSHNASILGGVSPCNFARLLLPNVPGTAISRFRSGRSDFCRAVPSERFRLLSDLESDLGTERHKEYAGLCSVVAGTSLLYHTHLQSFALPDSPAATSRRGGFPNTQDGEPSVGGGGKSLPTPGSGEGVA